MLSASKPRASERLNFALYTAVARLGFRRQFAYPQATVWGLITNTFFGLLRLSILVALFGSRPQVAGFSVQDAITYAGIGQAMIMALSLFGWYDFMRTIHRGEVAGDLLRPHHLLGFWAAQDAGRAAAQLLLRGLPMILIFAVLWGATFPHSAEGWFLTTLSVLLAWASGFLFRFLVNCAAFWSPDAVGIGRFAWAVLGLCCGFLMPLAFFPAWFQQVLHYTPFPGMLNTTVELWLGQKNGAAGWAALGTQLGWTLLLYVLTSIVLARGLRKLEVAGG